MASRRKGPSKARKGPGKARQGKSKKRAGGDGSSGQGSAAGASAARTAEDKKSPSVMQFLERLGGAPSAPRRQTPARGLLGKVKRSDLIEAGRIAPDSPEGPPVDPHPTKEVLVQPSIAPPGSLHANEGPLEVEVSVPDGEAVGRAPRMAWRESVRVASVLAGPHRSGRAGNLSSSGIFIETTHILDLGDPLVLAFPTEGGAPLNVAARVRWVSPFGGTKDAQPGMGIEFVGLDARKRHRLEALLVGLPVLPEDER